jgi:hypothetical protein
VRHHEVEISGASIASIVMIRRHEHGGGQRHEFPGEQECHDIGGDEHEFHGAQHDAERCDDCGHSRRRNRMGQVSDAVGRHRDRDDAEHHQEPRRERSHRVRQHHAGRGVMQKDAVERASPGKNMDGRRHRDG